MTIDALAVVAHLAGRTYEDEHGTHANLYLVSLARSAFYVAEGSFGKFKGRALAMLERHGGALDRSTWLRYLSIDIKAFKNLVVTLLASDMIEQEAVSNGKTVYHATTRD